MKRAIVLSAFVWVEFCGAQQPRFDGKTWWHHVEVLAADNMEGRETGSPGLRRAEAYLVEQLQKAGIAPAGTNGYYQSVKFEKREIVEKDSSAALVRIGKVESLDIGEHAFFTCVVDLAPKVEAPLVFVGYGMRIPEEGYDDFAGLDLRGKVAVTIAGTPEGIQGPLGAHYAELSQRLRAFREAGAIGWIMMTRPEVKWSSVAGERALSITHLADDEFDDSKGLQLFMWYNSAYSDKLFDGSGHTPAELFALAKEHKPLPTFTLPVSIRAVVRMLKKPMQSDNVLAKLEGSDPKLKNEYVVLSAHIDGHGIGEPVNGDRIYNGAIDNASGSAVLLDVAAELKRAGTRPKRSLLFAFFTGEEKGMLGSRYFTARPTAERKSIVTNLNVDGVHAILPSKALLLLGMDESDIGAAARRVTAAQGISFATDTEPQANRFTCCSDQRYFILHGIPAIN